MAIPVMADGKVSLIDACGMKNGSTGFTKTVIHGVACSMSPFQYLFPSNASAPPLVYSLALVNTEKIARALRISLSELFCLS